MIALLQPHIPRGRAQERNQNLSCPFAFMRATASGCRARRDNRNRVKSERSCTVRLGNPPFNIFCTINEAAVSIDL